MKLVIVESPSKAKTIEKYLGKDYKVMASKGHIVDLPKSEIGINVDNKFKPTYVVTKEASLKKLKAAFKDADELVLAVDPDREGEAIGWHVARELKLLNEKGDTVRRGRKLKRIVFTEITEEAVRHAIANPREINLNLVNAQQARRILDRLVGYKLSPLLWKKIRFGLSAGRVQSVAVKLIVDRERERDLFKADEYWDITAFLSQSDGKGRVKEIVRKGEEEKPEFDAKLLPFLLTKINAKKAEVGNHKAVEGIFAKLRGQKWIIDGIESKEVKRSPKPPFTTSTLQQAAANRFGMTARQTMSLAQKLYESGLITYMRTDSVTLSKAAINDARKYIGSKFGDKFMPGQPRAYKTKSKASQEAHEAVRPTNFKKQPGEFKLEAKQAKIYKLIWQRALASQMENAKLESSVVKIKIAEYLFQLNGQKILFPGFLKVYSEKVSETILPSLKEGQELYANTVFGDQHFTKPPARYSEASLIKALEAAGIGRPSTYAPIISTIMTRKYVEKDGRYFFPTDTGIVVTKLLETHFEDIVDTDFTAEMETSLDKIASGEQDWVKMLSDFYKPFIKNLEKKDKEIKREDFTKLGDSDKKCPLCKKPMIIKLGRYGRFLSCSDFPDCKGMTSMDGKTEEDIAHEAHTEKFLAIYAPAPKTDDDRDYILKIGRYGKFFAHPDYPKVKDARPLEYNTKIFKKVYGTAPKAKDGTKMILRRGRFGEFWAHPDYPDKKEVVRINKKEIAAKKEELGIASTN
ncbi:MAG: type I DNA topoisomerase [Candidatus Dojkabacteria bacterium]